MNKLVLIFISFFINLLCYAQSDLKEIIPKQISDTIFYKVKQDSTLIAYLMVSDNNQKCIWGRLKSNNTDLIFEMNDNKTTFYESAENYQNINNKLGIKHDWLSKYNIYELTKMELQEFENKNIDVLGLYYIILIFNNKFEFERYQIL